MILPAPHALAVVADQPASLDNCRATAMKPVSCVAEPGNKKAANSESLQTSELLKADV